MHGVLLLLLVLASHAPHIAMLGSVTLLREREAAEFLGIHPRTLKRWRLEGGVPYTVLAPRGRQRAAIRYPREALEEWVAARTHSAPAEQVPEPVPAPPRRKPGRPRGKVGAGGGAGSR